MKKMKKILSILLAAVVLALTGCNSSKTNPNDVQSPPRFEMFDHTKTYGKYSMGYFGRDENDLITDFEDDIILEWAYTYVRNEDLDTELKSLLRSASYEEVNYYPCDAEFFKISFWELGTTEDEVDKVRQDVFILYEYLKEDLFALFENTVYRIQNTEQLVSYIHKLLSDATKSTYGRVVFDPVEWYEKEHGWAVPATIGEFRFIRFFDTDKSNDPTRYDGFVNTEPVTMSNVEDVAERANMEIGYQNYKAHVYFDKLTGYWMIRLYDLNQKPRHWVEVFLDNQGITLEVLEDSLYIYEGALTPEDAEKWEW